MDIKMQRCSYRYLNSKCLIQSSLFSLLYLRLIQKWKFSICKTHPKWLDSSSTSCLRSAEFQKGTGQESIDGSGI